MKKGIFSSFIGGIIDTKNGESYGRILRYFFPEFITALVLYSLLYLLDAVFIAHLRSTSLYTTQGLTNTMLHFIVKFAEGISVGTIILCGRFNGVNKFDQVGETLRDSFWINFFSGLSVSSILYFGAYWIYYYYGVPADMIEAGVPFLRLRAVGVFFMFLYFSFIGFMRGIKNTKTPMKIFIAGAIVFLFFDYVLIFGKLGFPQMGLQGSAWASVLQYTVMLILSTFPVFFNKKYRKYTSKLFYVFLDVARVKKLLMLSWPVVLDKSTFAISYMWMGKVLAPMGKYVLATFTVVKDLERFAFLPAVAFAQIITFLVSNDYGNSNWDGITSNIKKVVFLSSIAVFLILIVISVWPRFFIQFFDKKGDFTDLAATVIPFLAVLVFLDVLQLILSGAMRGASNVKTVMITRLVVCGLFFIPLAEIISRIKFESESLKFILIYGVFYIGSGIMSLVYICRFRSNKWKGKE